MLSAEPDAQVPRSRQPRGPLSRVENLTSLSARCIWRCKDSSEKTPSPISSIDESYIFPAIVISSTNLAHVQTAANYIPRPDSPLRAHPSEELGPNTIIKDESQVLPATPDPSRPPPPSPPAITPLQPLYPPPERSPTPPGLPSFDASQHAAESRLTRRIMETHLGLPHREDNSGCGPRDAPVWRPPVSQYANLWLQRGGAEAETAAHGDRAARPVRLEDFLFLEAMDGTGDLEVRGSGWFSCRQGCWPRWCCSVRTRESDELDVS